MKKWFIRRHKATAAEDEGLAAKIQAEVDHKAALETLREASERCGVIQDMNTKNHFSRDLERSFRGRTV